jgi:iron complex outermembrane receptor protein
MLKLGQGLAKVIRLRQAIFPLLLLGFFTVSIPTFAADAGSNTADFRIDPAQLADALSQFGAQSGVQVVYSPEVAQGLNVRGVSGRLTVDAALKQLLAGTGITWSYVNSDTVVLKREQTQKSPAADPVKKTRLDKSESSPAAIGEIVVSAQKKGEERLNDTPVPVSVLNADNLAETGQVLLKDYYALVPGLSVAPYYTSAQNITIRGITTGGFANPVVGVLVDDVPFMGSVGQGGTQGVNVPDFDPGDLARVEVLRGPQGTLYGASSMGGLIKYVTRDPSTDGYSGRVEAGTSSVYNGAQPGFNVRASANIPLGETLAMRASAFQRQDPGYIDNPATHVDGINVEQVYGGRISALWRPSEAASLKLSALYQYAHRDGLNEVDVQPGLGDLQQNYIPGAGLDTRIVQAYSAAVDWKLPGVDLTSVTGFNINEDHNTLDWSFVQGPAAQKLFGVSSTVYSAHPIAKKFSQELRLSGSFRSNIDWLIGGFYTHESGNNTSAIYAEDTSTGQFVGTFGLGNNQVAFKEYAGFVDLTYHFTDRFDIQVGGRESHNDLEKVNVLPPSPTQRENDSVFTYLFTPRFRLSPNFMLYGRFASGYRPGTPSSAVSVQAGAPAQSSADKTQNYEIGTKADFLDNRLSIDASLYYIDWKNIQLTLLQQSTHFIYSTNGGAAKSEGVEFSVTVRPWDGLVASGWVSYDDAVLTEMFPASSTAYGAKGDRLPFTPRYSANLSLEQEFPLSDNATGFVGALASYVGERTSLFTATPVRQQFPAYTKTDLRAGVRYDSWTASMYANNVANAGGVLNGGIAYFYPQAFIYITPRTVGLTLTKTFR